MVECPRYVSCLYDYCNDIWEDSGRQWWRVVHHLCFNKHKWQLCHRFYGLLFCHELCLWMGTDSVGVQLWDFSPAMSKQMCGNFHMCKLDWKLLDRSMHTNIVGKDRLFDFLHFWVIFIACSIASGVATWDERCCLGANGSSLWWKAWSCKTQSRKLRRSSPCRSAGGSMTPMIRGVGDGLWLYSAALAPAMGNWCRWYLCKFAPFGVCGKPSVSGDISMMWPPGLCAIFRSLKALRRCQCNQCSQEHYRSTQCAVTLLACEAMPSSDQTQSEGRHFCSSRTLQPQCLSEFWHPCSPCSWRLIVSVLCFVVNRMIETLETNFFCCSESEL